MQRTSKLTSSDVLDVNPKTGALVLGKNRLEDYATKYLAKHCKEALMTPMALPVDKILQNDGLTVREASLSRNQDIFGCCLLLDGEVDIYDRVTGQTHSVLFPAGTILIDPDSEALYGEGVKRNTLIHEALHWEKDKRYFEILALKNAEASEKLYPIMCRQSETYYEPPEGKKTKENEVRWLEWQAHRLAPRVLMPYEMFKKKALELINSHKNPQTDSDYTCDALIEDLSTFFIVSRSSVKYRLLEVELLDEISKFDDYDALYAEISNRREYVPLTPVEAYQLLCTDSSLKEWVSGGRFIFADGYFVLANSKYVTAKNGSLHLTARAKKNLQKCAINIHEQSYKSYSNIHEDFEGFAVLHRVIGVDQRILTFHPQYQSNFQYEQDDAYAAFNSVLTAYDENEEIELIKRLGDPTTTLCQCLTFLMENRKWKYPSKFRECTKLHENYFGKIKRDDYNNMGTGVLMAICVGLKMNLRLTEKIFEKSKNKLDYYHDPDKTYIHIMETMPCMDIVNFNCCLSAAGIEKLGTIGEDEE